MADGRGPTKGRLRLVAGAVVASLLLPLVPAVAGAQEGPDAPPPTADPGAGAEQPGPPSDAPGLDPADRELVAQAESDGDATVLVLVAAEAGRLDEAIVQLRSIGGQVVSRDTDIDYVAARVPTGRADTAAKLPYVAALDVNGVVALDDPYPSGVQAPNPQTPPSAATPAVNPYMPTGEIGAPQFVAANPTYDGRGTVVAIIDSGIDLGSPALTATTPDGRPKVTQWLIGTDAGFTGTTNDDGDGAWVKMTGSHTGTGPNGSVLPATGGPYSYGTLVENTFSAGGELGGDLDRNGVGGETFGVIRDTTSGEVLVDTDRDGDFTDQDRMTDLSVANRDIGRLGTDDPATPVSEELPFVVDTRFATTAGSVGIGYVASAHGSHVAGIVAADGILGGAIDGVAPGAQLMSVRACLTYTGCTNYALVEGMIDAADAGADVANMSIGGLGALNDGNNARAELYDRIIREKGMQIVLSGGNDGAGSNTIGDPAVVTTALTVGASVSRDTWRSNYGSDSAAAMGVFPFSSRGPREDGGFKPDVVAPGSAISTIPTWQPGAPTAGTYPLPPGYGMLNGTSMASPQAAGAAALLIGAWKATHGGARPDPVALRDALTGSATPISGVPTAAQGTGLIDVRAAWARLQAGYGAATVRASVPVDTLLAGFLATPGVGTGIHVREGLVAGGATITRTYTLTRTTGAAGTRIVPVRWVGDDGTFTSPASVALPLGTPVPLPVRITPSAAGAHSAQMIVDDPATAGVELRTMNAAFVATPFVDGVATLTGTVGRNETRHMFVKVPGGAPTLNVRMTGGGAAAGTGQLRFLRFHPYGTGLDGAGSLVCYTPDAGGGCSTGSPSERSLTAALAGTWEVVVENRRTSDAAEAPFTLEVTFGRMTVSPRREVLTAQDPGALLSRSFTVTNRGGPVPARLQGGPLTSVLSTRPTIADLAQAQRPISVPAGTTRLDARIGAASDPGADLDLSLFNCTSGSCVLAAQSADGDSEESVSVDNPAAGTWVTLVDGFSVPSGTTSHDYVDSLLNPAFGTLTVADVLTDRPTGSSWTVPGTLAVRARPAAGRILVGRVDVQTAGGGVLGRGTIELGGDELIPTTTSLTPSPADPTLGEPVTLDVRVTSPIGAASGTVDILEGDTVIASAPVAEGRAQVIVSDLGEGRHDLRAAFSATTAHADSESATDIVTVGPAPAPTPPAVDAGADQAVRSAAEVALTGTASDTDGELTSTLWAQQSGPPVEISGADTLTPSFTAPAGPATLTFSLTAIAGDGEFADDLVTVTVNGAPTADADGPARVEPGETVTLDGTGSSDPDGDTLTYLWEQVSGSAVTITGADTATAGFTMPTSAVSVRLTVTDPSGDASSDVVDVAANQPPSVDAGPDQKVNPGATVALAGTASDTEGDGLTYAWAQTSGPAVTLTGADTLTPTFTAPASGVVVLSLTVTDALGGEGTDSVTITVNGTPVAAAGPDQLVGAGTTVTLDATGSTDPDGDVLTFTWQQQGGPAVTLSDTHVASPSFTAPATPGPLTFSVTVVDPMGRLSTDLVTITVDRGPTADAGDDQVTTAGTTVTLDGSGSADAEGDLTYAWTQTAGPAVTLAGPTSVAPTFTAPADGTLTFRVTVTDAGGNTATDTVTVRVEEAPIADAGDDATANPGDVVTLDGSGSDDPDGEALTFAWAQTAGPQVTLAGADGAAPSFTAPAGPATLTFTLTATDGLGLTATDAVVITVNGAPTATAGADQVVAGGATVTLGGSATDPDDDAVTYAWMQTAGPAVTLVGADTATATFTAPTGPASFAFTLTVTDEGGAGDTDTVGVSVSGVPVAAAGTDATVDPASSVTLDGRGSSDPDGDVLAYGWAQTAGVTVALTGGATAQPTFVAPAGPQVLTFRLTVTDAVGQTATDEVTVTVNGVPDASAGDPQTVDEGDVVTIDASASTDPDGDALTYAWEQQSGPAVALSSATAATPTFTAPTGPQSIVFLVRVTDVHGATDTAATTVTVVPPLTSDERWVVEAYSTFLHRVPDSTGLAFWVAQLDAGRSRTAVARTLAFSPEATRGPVVTDLYDRLLDRGVSSVDRAYWADRIQRGLRYHWVERTLLASAERYQSSGGTNVAFVTDLYQRVLHRAGEPSGVAYWVARLDRGAPRLSTVDALLNTPEARRVRVAEVAESILGRPLTGEEAGELGRRFASTRDPRDIAIAAFLWRP